MLTRQTERQKPFHFDQGRPAELSALRLIAQALLGGKSECIEHGGAQMDDTPPEETVAAL